MSRFIAMKNRVDECSRISRERAPPARPFMSFPLDR